MVRDLDLDSKLKRGHALLNTEKKSSKFIFIKIIGWYPRERNVHIQNCNEFKISYFIVGNDIHIDIF